MERRTQHALLLSRLRHLGYAYELNRRNKVISVSPNYSFKNRLIVSWKELSSIFQQFKSLKSIFIEDSDMSIEDLDSISDLIHLKHIDLCADIEISSLSPLKNLTKLKYFKLSKSCISDLSAVAELDKLEELSLPHSAISDIGPLRTLNRLREINLLNNNINDVSAISDLTELEAIDFSENQITALDTGKLKKLRSVRLNDNQLRNIDFINDMEDRLEELAVSNNLLTGICLPSIFNNLKILEVSGIRIDSDQLMNFTVLQKLIASGSSLSDIRFLQYMDRLQHLDLSNNHIGNHFNLSYFPGCLYSLNLADNHISYPENIAAFYLFLGPNLQELDLSGNSFGGKKFIANLGYSHGEIYDFKQELKKALYQKGDYDTLSAVYYLDENPIVENYLVLYDRLIATPRKDELFRQHYMSHCERTFKPSGLSNGDPSYEEISRNITREKRRSPAVNKSLEAYHISAKSAEMLNSPHDATSHAHSFYILAKNRSNNSTLKFYYYKELVRLNSPFQYALIKALCTEFSLFPAGKDDQLTDIRRNKRETLYHIKDAVVEDFDLVAYRKVQLKYQTGNNQIFNLPRWRFIAVIVLLIIKLIRVILAK